MVLIIRASCVAVVGKDTVSVTGAVRLGALSNGDEKYFPTGLWGFSCTLNLLAVVLPWLMDTDFKYLPGMENPV